MCYKVRHRKHGWVCDTLEMNASLANLIFYGKIGGLHGWQWIVSNLEELYAAVHSFEVVSFVWKDSVSMQFRAK